MNVPVVIPAGPVPADYLIDPDSEVWIEWNRLCPGMVVLPYFFSGTSYPESHAAWILVCRSVSRNGGVLVNGQYANGQGMTQPYGDRHQFLVKRTSLPFIHPSYLPPTPA